MHVTVRAEQLFNGRMEEKRLSVIMEEYAMLVKLEIFSRAIRQVP